MNEKKLKKKVFSFFCENKYESQIAHELAERGYKIELNKFVDETEIVIGMGIQSTFNLFDKMQERNLLKKNKIIQIHNFLDLPYWRLNTKLWKNYYNAYKKILENSDYIIGLSQTSLNDLKKYWGIDGTVLFSYFMNKDIDNNIENIKNIEKENQILSIGRLAPNKMFEIVLEALGVIKFKGKYIIITPECYGNGENYLKYYKELAKKYGIDLEVKVKISYLDLLKDLKKSKLCVVPTVFEGLGHPSFESIWVGTEFIAADIPVKREFHNNTIHYAKPNNVIDFAKKIRKVLSGELKTDFDMAKKQIEPYTVENITDKFIKFLLEEVYNNEQVKSRHNESKRYNPK